MFSFSSFNCRQTTWSQTDVVRTLSRSFTNISANRPPLCHPAEHPQPSLQLRVDITEASHLSALPCSLLFFFSSSFFKRIEHATHKINPYAASRRPAQNSLPSEFNTATLEKSSDKDRATLTVHIRTFENTLQQLTHIQPTECTYEQKKKEKKKKYRSSYPLHITFRLQTQKKKMQRQSKQQISPFFSSLVSDFLNDNNS